MDIKNLIRTSTVGMTREDWLAFRQPITHITKFIKNLYDDLSFQCEIFVPNQDYYDRFTELFKSQAWIDFEFPCVGGSEMGAIVGASKWKAAIEVYYEKLGIKPIDFEENAAMFWGKQLEAQIAEKWQYWDGSVEGMIANYNEEKILRKNRNINFYVQNKKCPWIFVSLDRVINKQKIQTGPETFVDVQEGVLECKTIAGYYAKLWESGTPLEYIIQIQTQEGVTELSWGELALLIDGREMQVLPFEFKPTIFEPLVHKSEAFFRKVKKAMEHVILSKCAISDEIQKMHMAEIDSLAPEPDGSISYESYLKENLNDRGFEIQGGPEELHWAQQHEIYKTKIEILENEKRFFANSLKTKLGEASVMKFGPLDDGQVTWRANKNQVRSLRISIKVDQAEQEKIEAITKED